MRLYGYDILRWWKSLRPNPIIQRIKILARSAFSVGRIGDSPVNIWELHTKPTDISCSRCSDIFRRSSWGPVVFLIWRWSRAGTVKLITHQSSWICRIYGYDTLDFTPLTVKFFCAVQRQDVLKLKDTFSYWLWWSMVKLNSCITQSNLPPTHRSDLNENVWNCFQYQTFYLQDIETTYKFWYFTSLCARYVTQVPIHLIVTHIQGRYYFIIAVQWYDFCQNKL